MKAVHDAEALLAGTWMKVHIAAVDSLTIPPIRVRPMAFEEVLALQTGDKVWVMLAIGIVRQSKVTRKAWVFERDKTIGRICLDGEHVTKARSFDNLYIEF